MTSVVRESLAFPRLLSVLISSFAGLAGLLAATGVYGLVSYAVSQRRREFGIRVAMGASRREVLSLVLRWGAVLSAAGIGVGVPAALAATRTLRTLLYEVAPTDPAVLVAACAGVLVAALAACCVPARAAAKADPMTTIRTS